VAVLHVTIVQFLVQVAPVARADFQMAVAIAAAFISYCCSVIVYLRRINWFVQADTAV